MLVDQFVTYSGGVCAHRRGRLANSRPSALDRLMWFVSSWWMWEWVFLAIPGDQCSTHERTHTRTNARTHAHACVCARGLCM